MQERAKFVETEILMQLKASYPGPVLRFKLSGIDEPEKDPDVTMVLSSLLNRGIIRGEIQTTGYDSRIRRPTPFFLTDYGVGVVETL